MGGVAGGLLGATLSFFGTRALFLVAARRRQQQVQRTFDVLVNEVRSVARPVERAAESLAEARARQGIADAPRASLVEDQATVGVTAEAAVTRVR
ncbi:MAG: hypothetical protein IT383_23740 [Deltaproteobacteria bacterium]|nr:hypothetical protein [Deltaproteobacteria bacterium]